MPAFTQNWGEAQTWTLRILCTGGVILVGGAVWWSGRQIDPHAGLEVTLPLLIIGGVLVLLVALALISILFAMTDLADKSQALGLPEGSVRAVIALTLVLLFAIVAIFLYANVAKGGRIDSTSNLSAADVDAFKASVPSAQILITQAQPAVEGTPARFTIIYRTTNSPASDDLAKQLIVLLGTLVTAVASFYFGANSVSAATAATAKALAASTPPAPTGVTPTTLRRGGEAQQLTISGKNLNQVNAVKLTKDGTTIDATVVTTGPSQATCTITIDANSTLGKWDVVVSDGTNPPVTLNNMVDLQAPAAVPPAPEMTAITPVSLKRDIAPQPFQISGDNLSQVKEVTLQNDGTIISAKKVTANATQVTGEFTIDDKQKVGKWNLFAEDGTTKTKLGEIQIS